MVYSDMQRAANQQGAGLRAVSFMESSKLRLGVSSCLLGQNVRYDGQHKRDRFVTDILGAYVSYVPVCPEYECGLGIPREAMRLEGDPAAPRLVTVRTRRDVTAQMQTYARERVADLADRDLCGFIFKSGSPSSGMERVKVYGSNGIPIKNGVGIFARALMDRFPALPVEEDGRLQDPALRENFIERIFAYRRWKDMVMSAPSGGSIVAFHTRIKLQVLAHSTECYRDLGRLTATGGKGMTRAEFAAEYERRFLEALKQPATAKTNTNVLHHAMGYFKNVLSADEKQELLEIIDAYRLQHVPLVVPIVLLQHYVRKYKQPYLDQQFYLDPHPMELQLRNHC